MVVSTVCYCTTQGLGVLAREFYVNGVVTHPVLLRHGARPNHQEWYPDGTPFLVHTSRTFGRDLRQAVLTHGGGRADAVLFFETPFRWELVAEARQLGVPTLLMVMYECTPSDFPPGCKPDVILTPSALDQDYHPDGVRCTVPAVKPGHVRPGPIRTFVHNAGHGGLRGRNGTEELLLAWPMVNRQAKLILRSQEKLDSGLVANAVACGNVLLEVGTVPPERLYQDGECFVFPEKFNGLSLPLQEAFANGMVVAATARRPNTVWLPNEPLIPVVGYRKARVAPRFREFDEAVIDPADVAATLNRLYGTDPAWLSRQGVVWAEQNGWDTWGPWYRNLIARVAKV